MIRSRNIRYDDNPHFLDALSEINHPSKHILVQIFSGVQELATIENCLADIKSALPEAAIIGVTTAGEIVDGRSLNETMNVNITLFDHTEVLSALVDQNDDLTLAGRRRFLMSSSPAVRLGTMVPARLPMFLRKRVSLPVALSLYP